MFARPALIPRPLSLRQAASPRRASSGRQPPSPQCLSIAYLRRLVAAGLPLLSAFLAASCTPPSQPAETKPTQASSLHAPADAADSGETTSDALDPGESKIDRSACGLPMDIVEADWPRRLEPSQVERPTPPKKDSWNLAVLPDTQYYASCRERHFAEQTAYLARRSREGQLLAALQLGDLTEHNSPEEWQYVVEALSLLPRELPTFLATGNHDYGLEGVANERRTLFHRFLGDGPNEGTRSVVAERMDPETVENAYYRIPWGKAALGVLVLEWSPRTQTVAWAQQVLDRHPEDRVIFLTHAYLFHDDTRYDWARHGPEQPWNPKAYGTAKKDTKLPYSKDNAVEAGAYDGEDLWTELVSKHPGVFLTLNGHVLGDGTGLLSSRGEHGNLVHQVLVNYQMLEEGGLGYLRLIEIAADGASLHMTSYSPSLRLYASAPDQDFELKIDPPLGRR